MAYWWVNQNQTFEHEIGGGYIWSPQTKANGHRNPYYDTMTRVEPGDQIFSFKDTLIQAIGIADSQAFQSPKPAEFSASGNSWADVGWRVPVTWELLPAENRIRPKDHMQQLEPVLPQTYSPLMPNGDGKQAVYLAEVPGDMAAALMSLIGQANSAPQSRNLDDLQRRVAEDAERARITAADMPATTKVALVESRIGQGQFRSSVLGVEPRCRFTGVSNPALLTASHRKPWVDCDNAERLDGYNGLMLTPTFDRLFDRGFISLTDTGEVLAASDLEDRDMHALGLHLPLNVGPLHREQCLYLEYHRTFVFRG